MKVLVFAGKMPDLCGAFLHDVDLSDELQRRGHQVVFMILQIPKEGVNGGTYRGFRFMHYSAGASFLESSQVWICPHAPALPYVRALNGRGYNRPIVATCHYDGNYLAITTNNPGRNVRWVEMLLFINNVMEPNFRKNIVPWPPNVTKTGTVRPILHEEKILITEPFQGEYITLVNANQNKGVAQFIEIARKQPTRKFLGILPYYGNLDVPDAPDNIKWIPFDDDIRNILKETRILLLPSYYESFGRIAVEAMLNGIPVLYSKTNPNSKYPGGSTEGVESWIKPVGISCHREKVEEWIHEIEVLDSPEVYSTRSAECREHIKAMDLFNEGSRIAKIVEDFAQENPVVIKKTVQEEVPQQQKLMSSVPKQPPAGARVGFSLSSGRLRIQR
jgi:glycosyltransferase involved in cell wall biosynthesis